MATSPDKVDDRDPQVIYLGPSNAMGKIKGDYAYDNTLTWLSTGGTAQISFVGKSFNVFQTPLPHPIKGSSIGVYGTNWADSPRRKPAPACNYTIDGGTPVRFTSIRTANTTWGELFFQSSDLPKIYHVLIITYDDDSSIKDSLNLDYFMVDGTAVLPSNPSSSLTTSFLSSATTTSSTTSNTPVLSPSPSFSTLESSSSSPTPGATPASGVATVSVQGKSESKLPIGPIIGGALGALTFICTVFLILYFRRRRQEGHSYDYIGAPLMEIGKNSRFVPYLRWLIIPIPSFQGDHRLVPTIFHNPPSTAAEENHSWTQGRE
jgi:hypothetical protein